MKGKMEHQPIPVRCFSCGRVIDPYVKKYLAIMKSSAFDIPFLERDTDSESPHGKAMTSIGITTPCCRRMLLSITPK